MTDSTINECLEDETTDKACLALRMQLWLGQDEQKGMPAWEYQGLKDRLFQYHDDPTFEIEVYKNYFFTGDIDTFVKASERVRFADIIFYSPVQSFQSFLCVIEKAIEWLLKNPEKMTYSNTGPMTIQKYLASIFRCILSPPNGNHLPDHIILDMFFYTYGDIYQPTRKVKLTQGGNPFIYEFEIDVEDTCSNLRRGIRHYIWGGRDRGDNTRYKYLMDYFFSIYLYYDPINFSITDPSKSAISRWFIASLHNIATIDYDLDENHDPLEALVINDQKSLTYLKEGMEKIKMPAEYYELEKFVLIHGEDCIEASV
jgi:hypothetical protein